MWFALGVALGVVILLPAMFAPEKGRPEPTTFLIVPLLLGIMVVAWRARCLFPQFDLAWHRPPDRPRTGVMGNGQPARVLYDVLDDRPFRISDLELVPFALVPIALVSVLVGAGVAGRLTANPGLLVLLIPAVLFTFQSVWLFLKTREWARDQARCKQWRRTGDAWITEGVITDYSWKKGGRGKVLVFRVAEVSFVVETNPATGGFQLAGVQGTENLTAVLPEESTVRIMHRDSRILRIEVLASPQSASRGTDSAGLRPCAGRASADSHSPPRDDVSSNSQLGGQDR
jgi:hypothetical protein